MNKSTIYTIIALGLLAISGIVYRTYHSSILRKNGIYTIITLEKIKGGGRGCEIDVYFSYTYKGIKHEGRADCYSRTEVSEKDIGHRFFMKFTPDKNGFVNLLFRCIVPDTLQAPANGWSQEWMEEHFPNCVREYNAHGSSSN